MKRLIIILGPNGVGKSTVSAELLRQLPNSAYIDSDTLRMVNLGGNTNELLAIQKINILALMRNYFTAAFIKNVIFPYGLHGHRKIMLDEITSELQNDFDIELFTIILTCDEDENIRRMESDRRDNERIRRALDNTRAIFDNLEYPKIDTTALTPEETAKKIILFMNGKTVK